MATPNTTDFPIFLDACPGRKSEMILEGFDRMVFEFNEARESLKVLTGWLNAMPSMVEAGHADLPDLVEFRKKVDRYVIATDELTAQIVASSDKINALALLYQKQSA